MPRAEKTSGERPVADRAIFRQVLTCGLTQLLYQRLQILPPLAVTRNELGRSVLFHSLVRILWRHQTVRVLTHKRASGIDKARSLVSTTASTSDCSECLEAFADPTKAWLPNTKTLACRFATV
jgi:hypothetical protein